MRASHLVWQDLGPGSGDAFAEGQRGLTDEQQDAIYFGERLDEPLPDVEITYLHEGRIGNVIGSAFSALIVSAPVLELLDAAAPGQMQFMPARLPAERRGYAVLNLLAHVACFDLERSDYDRLPGRPDRLMTVRRLVLRRIPDDAPALFHIAELPGAILVRDDLRGQLEELGEGVGEFVRVEDFTWGMV